MKFRTFFAKKAVYIPLIIILLIAGINVIYSATHKPVYETATAEEREFVQEVSVTGKVVAANDVELAFESGGKVSRLSVVAGAKVAKGAILASVGSSDLYASLLGAQARQQSAQADLDEVLRGTRASELSNLEDAVGFARSDLVLAINKAYLAADDSLRGKIDVMYENPTGAYPNLPSFGNGSIRERLEKKRVEIGNMLEKWKKTIDTLSVGGYKDSYHIEAKDNLESMSMFIDELAEASSLFRASESITETERATYIANISTARTTVNTAISTLASASQALTAAQGDLDLATEGSTQEEINRAEAAVKSAYASVLQAQAALAKTSIAAPFSGTITKIDLRVGEFVSPGTPVISMISDANFEIESFVPEADIAKVKVGDVGTTTLDAYGDTAPFSVVVTAIDLSETEVEGVATYKTTLQFTATDDRIRSGMTANIDLASETRQGVLSVPQTALISAAGKRTVLVMGDDGKPVSREVVTGAIDNAGNIEIKSGIKAGELVVSNPPKK